MFMEVLSRWPLVQMEQVQSDFAQRGSGIKSPCPQVWPPIKEKVARVRNSMSFKNSITT